jgi:hypothetical protein
MISNELQPKLITKYYTKTLGGHAVARFVEALCYKVECRGFDSRCHWIFNWPNASRCTMGLGSTQPLTEMSIRNLPEGKRGQCVRLTISLPSVSWLSRKCGSLDISQHYVTGIALPFYTKAHIPNYHNENIRVLKVLTQVTTLTFGKRVTWRKWECTATCLQVSKGTPYPPNHLQPGVAWLLPLP